MGSNLNCTPEGVFRRGGGVAGDRGGSTLGELIRIISRTYFIQRGLKQIA